jgi:hypothetical protein
MSKITKLSPVLQRNGIVNNYTNHYQMVTKLA